MDDTNANRRKRRRELMEAQEEADGIVWLGPAPPGTSAKRRRRPLEECSICVDKIELDCEHIVQLTCNHCFHLQCIGEWYESAQKPDGYCACPNCRCPFLPERLSLALTETERRWCLEHQR